MRRVLPSLILAGACANGTVTIDPADTDPAIDPTPATDSAPEIDIGGDGPNILLLLLDDVGIDKLAVYGVARNATATPNLDALAAQGVRFSNAWAQPTCSPARASLLTGRQPEQHGLGRFIDSSTSDYAFPRRETTLPELLSKAPVPYTSVAVGKWHIDGFLSPDPAGSPLRHGFAHHRGALGNPVEAIPVPEPRVEGDWQRSVDGVLSWTSTYMTTAEVDDALELIATTPEPWFAYVAFHAAHKPWEVPPAPLPGSDVDPSASDADRYDAVVRALDAEIGRLLASVDPQVLARTYIVLMSDNGSPGQVIRLPLNPTRAKGTVYEGGVRVPLVVVGPGVAVGTSDALVSIVDLLPTLTELAGMGPEQLTSAEGLPLDLSGHSLRPWLSRPATPDDGRVLFTETFAPNGYVYDPTRVEEVPTDLRFAVRDADWKLAYQGAAGVQFFDVRGRDFDEGAKLDTARLTPEAQAAFDRLEGVIETHGILPGR